MDGLMASDLAHVVKGPLVAAYPGANHRWNERLGRRGNGRALRIVLRTYSPAPRLVGTVVLGATLVAEVVAYMSSRPVYRPPLYAQRVTSQEFRNFSDYALVWLKPIDSSFLALVGACISLAVVGVVSYSMGATTLANHP
jgi:hypothetical protein